MKHPARYTLEERAEADKMSLDAMERNIKKKPERLDAIFRCECGNQINRTERILHHYKYCCECGTAIDWSDD